MLTIATIAALFSLWEDNVYFLSLTVKCVHAVVTFGKIPPQDKLYLPLVLSTLYLFFEA